MPIGKIIIKSVNPQISKFSEACVIQALSLFVLHLQIFSTIEIKRRKKIRCWLTMTSFAIFPYLNNFFDRSSTTATTMFHNLKTFTKGCLLTRDLKEDECRSNLFVRFKQLLFFVTSFVGGIL